VVDIARDEIGLAHQFESSLAGFAIMDREMEKQVRTFIEEMELLRGQASARSKRR